MNKTEYFQVFEAIIYGLALTEILIGLNRMIQERRTIKIYWAHLLFVFIYIEILISHYSWEFYRNAFDLVNSGMGFLVYVVIYPASFFFGAYQGFPKVMERTDFKEFFHSRKKEILFPVLAMQAAAVNLTTSERISKLGWDYLTSASALGETWLQALLIPLIASAALSNKKWPTEALAVIGFLVQLRFTLAPFES